MQLQLNNLRITATALGLALLLVGGCTEYKDYDAFVKDPQPLVTTTEYRLAPPDVILIESARTKEINGHTEMIRPDGKITLPLIGSVNVTGLTCEEAGAELQKRAREFYTDADVTLRVAAYNSKKIYVYGEVQRPGPYSYSGTNTIFNTLMDALPTRLADETRIEVLRPNKDGKLVKRMTINFEAMAERGDSHLNAILEEGDVINVPANVLAAAGLIMQQVLLPIQPAAATVKGPSDIESTVNGSQYGRVTGAQRGGGGQ